MPLPLARSSGVTRRASQAAVPWNGDVGRRRQWSEDSRHPVLGSALRIRLPAEQQGKGRAFQLAIRYETTAKCSAAQWLSPAYASCMARVREPGQPLS